MAFKTDAIYSRAQIHEVMGGDLLSLFLRSKNRVVGCRYKPKLNSLMPKTLLVGSDGPRKFASAEMFAKQGNYIPFFAYVGPEQWRYVGDFRVSEWSKNTSRIAAEKVRGNDSNVAIILTLEALTKDC